MTDHNELLQKRIYLRPDEVAEILAVSKKTVYNYINAGHFEYFQLEPGGPIRIFASSVKKYIGMKTSETAQ